MKRALAWVVLITALALPPAGAKEILFHSGPIVFSPDAILLDPVDKEREEKDLQFIYEFFVDKEVLRRASGNHAGDPPMPPAKAIELAVGSVGDRQASNSPSRDKAVPKEYKAADGSVIRYHLVTVQVDDNAETHRVVLMDGTVLKPRLRRITER